MREQRDIFQERWRSTHRTLIARDWSNTSWEATRASIESGVASNIIHAVRTCGACPSTSQGLSVDHNIAIAHKIHATMFSP